MFIIPNQTRFAEVEFSQEAEIEKVFFEHYPILMGESTVFLPKARIRTGEGSGTIPDGYAFDLDANEWYLIEVELLKHGVWQHIVKQISMQLVAANEAKSKERILQMAIQLFDNDERFRGIVQDKGIKELHLTQRLMDIMKKEPLIGLPIDKVNSDLKTWATSLRTKVKIWEIKKFVDLSNPSIFGYYIPDGKAVINTVDPEPTTLETLDGLSKDDVTVEMLIKAGLLRAGEILWFDYTTRHNNKKNRIEGTLTVDGNLIVGGQELGSLSSAALYGISLAGITRPTINGWKTWRAEAGKLLFELRIEYLKNNG